MPETSIIKTMRFMVTLIPLSFLLAIKQMRLTRPMDYGRQKIMVEIDSKIELSRANSCRKEPGTVKWIEQYFKKSDVFYDIGANIGQFSLIAAGFLRGDIRAYAFEPHPSSYAKLCKNIMLNHYGRSIVPIAIALSDNSSLREFNYHDLSGGSSGHALGEALDSAGKSFTPIGAHNILSIRLDDLISFFGLPIPNHIKIDVDGIELKILKGAELTLKDLQVKTILVELEKSEHESEEAAAFLSKRGFVFHSKREGRNFLFVRK